MYLLVSHLFIFPLSLIAIDTLVAKVHIFVTRSRIQSWHFSRSSFVNTVRSIMQNMQDEQLC